MSVPTDLWSVQLDAECNGFRESLQHLIRHRQSFTEKELAKLSALGVSFDQVTRQLQWTPVNGPDAIAERNAYCKSLLALMEDQDFTFTAEELAEMEGSGLTFDDLLAEVTETMKAKRTQRDGQ